MGCIKGSTNHALVSSCRSDRIGTRCVLHLVEHKKKRKWKSMEHEVMSDRKGERRCRDLSLQHKPQLSVCLCVCMLYVCKLYLHSAQWTTQLYVCAVGSRSGSIANWKFFFLGLLKLMKVRRRWAVEWGREAKDGGEKGLVQSLVLTDSWYLLLDRTDAFNPRLHSRHSSASIGRFSPFSDWHRRHLCWSLIFLPRPRRSSCRKEQTNPEDEDYCCGHKK